MPVPSNEFLHPWRVNGTKYGLFGTPHNQPIDLNNLLVTDSFPAPAEVGEREVGVLRVNGQVRLDPNRQIWREGHDSVNNTSVLRLLDRYRKVAREERTMIEVVDQNFPLAISEGRDLLQD